MSRKPDYVFLGLLGAIAALGLAVLTSASGPVALQKFDDSYWYLKHQVAFGLVPGVCVFWAMSLIDYRIWRKFALPLLAAAIGLLALVFVPGVGAEWGTTRSWIGVAGYSLQPVEIAKLALVFYLAAWFERRVSGGRYEAGLLPFLGILGLVALLIMKQPDLGSLTVIAAMAIAMYFAAGAPFAHIAGIGLTGAALLGLLIKAAPYRAARFMTFLHPELDPRGVGYHINQALLAVGSGGLFGLGLGHSRQKYLYLPEVANDSIFAVMAEELGFVFTLAVLGLLIAFILRGMAIARRAPDAFGRLAGAGIVSWIFFQMLFNIGSMVGLMPLTGLPLPFVSYGGTALTVSLAAVGVLANISRHAPETPARR